MAVIVSAPLAVLPLVFSRYTVQLAESGLSQVKTLLVQGFKFLSFGASGLLLVGLFFTPTIKNYLHLASVTPALIMVFYLFLSLLLPTLLGVIQGLHRFLAFGLAASSISLFRLLSGLLLILAWDLGVNGALLSGTVGILAALVIAIWCLRDLRRVAGQTLPQGFFQKMRGYSFPVFVSTTMVMTLGNLDLVLVRHYCSPEESGLYSIAAILGRIALYLPGVLIVVLFPEAAKAQTTGNEDSRILWVSLGMTILLGGSFALVCTLWPEQIIVLLFGEKYQAAAGLLKIISLAMAMLAVANVIFTYSMARSEFKFLWPLVMGVGMMLLLIFNFHDSALTIATMVLVSIGLILTGTFFWYFLRSRSSLPS